MTNDLQWQAAAKVITAIEEAGYEAVIVGGAVRDFYLQKDLHDVDVATSATPQEVKGIFHATVDVGIEHGTVLVLDAGEPVEVTTYRTESTYKDHRRPDEVQFVRTLQDDLQRRDFTMNAMALTKEFHVIDYYGGTADIDARIIRAVGDPALRFEEDALRMLRAVRFVAQLGFQIEDATLQAMQKHAATIRYIAKERIVMELSKLFMGAHAGQGIAMLETSGLAQHLPGDWNHQDWQAFQTDKPDIGWAYVTLANPVSEPSILSQYKCSNKTKSFAKQVLQAYDALLGEWTAMDAFTFDWDVITCAWHFTQWQQHNCQWTLETLAQQKHTLPIATKRELAVTGHDLLLWSNAKKGPWLKVAIEQAIERVVSGQLPNEKQQLKDWFLHDFDNEE